MSDHELTSTLDEVVDLLDCYEALTNLVNANDSQTVILSSLNRQFRILIARLNSMGVLS